MASGISEECRDCFGRGYTVCDNCDGYLDEIGGCFVCRGEAEFDCPTCGATGYVEVEA